MAEAKSRHGLKECSTCGATICSQLGQCWPCFYNDMATPEHRRDRIHLEYPYGCSGCIRPDPRHAPPYVCPECLNGAIKAKCVKCRARAAAAKVKP